MVFVFLHLKGMILFLDMHSAIDLSDKQYYDVHEPRNIMALKEDGLNGFPVYMLYNI